MPVPKQSFKNYSTLQSDTVDNVIWNGYYTMCMPVDACSQTNGSGDFLISIIANVIQPLTPSLVTKVTRGQASTFHTFIRPSIALQIKDTCASK